MHCALFDFFFAASARLSQIICEFPRIAGGPNPNNVLPNPKPFPTTCQIRSVDEIHFNQSVSTGCAGMRPPAHGPQNALTPSASKTSPSATLRSPLALAAILILACALCWGAAEPWY
jgi:hypothetical protein